MVGGAEINAAKFASRFVHKLMKMKEGLAVGFDWVFSQLENRS